MAQDKAMDRTWQHKVPKIDKARTKDTDLDNLIKPRRKVITTARPKKRRP